MKFVKLSAMTHFQQRNSGAIGSFNRKKHPVAVMALQYLCGQLRQSLPHVTPWCLFGE